MFSTVLVANRGEISVRIHRTLRSMGISSVAVYSDEDRGALHVALADRAVRIGPAEPSQSYLNIDAVIDAAIRSDAQAIHPGYGFLAENATFARRCAEAGMTFVGPSPEAIEMMGDKIRSKQTVAANGVRIVPGIDGSGLSDEDLAAAAMQLGFPVLIKPSAGGGGKGMRRVESEESLLSDIASARREARAAFGDETLLVERLIEHSRHIEIQVISDNYGHFVHMGERECSLQRRHQKVIEEAPSPLLNDQQREALGAQGIAAAQACGYSNVGTVEFIASSDRPDEPFFMEMNTRLQVEHPVTEMVWGIDLVETQIRIAAGEALPFDQASLKPRGHAIEARVYAEDPNKGFLPTGGRVLALYEPENIEGIRIDSSLREGLLIGSTYDPMLSKVIAWGEGRDLARRRLESALGAISILGLTTNTRFLRELLAHPRVMSGTMDTALIDELNPGPNPDDHCDEAAVMAAVICNQASRGQSTSSGAWKVGDGWRIGPGEWIHWKAIGPNSTSAVVATRESSRGVEAKVRDRHIQIRGFEIDGHGSAVAEIDGFRWACSFAHSGDSIWIGHDGQTWTFAEVPLSNSERSAAHAGGMLTSPMPGIVIGINVLIGQFVSAGQTLCIVEAMKMEHNVTANMEGVVTDIAVLVGDHVTIGQSLVLIESLADANDSEQKAGDSIKNA